MDVDWIERAVRIITSICAVAAVAECTAGEEQMAEGLRMVCGVIAAATLVQMASDSLKALF